MTYETPQTLRMALEDRLRNRSAQTGISPDRLRRRVLFERIVARLEAAEPGQWVLKGGMALEVRLGDDARLTKDLDLGLRSEIDTAGNLHERLVDAFVADRDGDGFELAAATPQLLRADGAGHVTWRVSVAARLAGRSFGGIRLDVSPRGHELVATERVARSNALDFAGIPAAVVEIVDVNRHAAEKFHAMLRDFGDRENTRVRDLVDLVLLVEHDLLVSDRLAEAIRRVWAERDGADPPAALPPLPQSWPARYERLAAEHGAVTPTFADADRVIRDTWDRMFPLVENHQR
jgi:predicted nucleotidyltransferase component of viral defense system